MERGRLGGSIWGGGIGSLVFFGKVKISYYERIVEKQKTSRENQTKKPISR